MTALVVRTFPTPSEALRLVRTLELPCVPVAGHRVTVPGSGPLVVDRVIFHARGWAPGLLPVTVEVELEAQAEAHRAGALERGWHPVETV